MTWQLRTPEPDDVPVIVQTYCRGSRSTLRRVERRVLTEWRRIAELRIAQALEDDEVLVAGVPGTDAVLGYAIGWTATHCESPMAVVEWVWVKEIYRRRGIARALVKALTANHKRVAITSTRTPEQRAYVKRHGWQVLERMPWIRLLERIQDERRGTDHAQDRQKAS